MQTQVDCNGLSIVLAVLPNAPRSQASSDSFCKSFSRLDVALPDLFGLRVLGFHQPRASLARSLLCCSRISHPASAKEVDMKRVSRLKRHGIYVAYRAVRQLGSSHDSFAEHRAARTRNSNQSPCISQDSQPQSQPKWIAGVPIVETVGTFETVREGIHERRRSRGGVPLFNQVGGTHLLCWPCHQLHCPPSGSWASI